MQRSSIVISLAVAAVVAGSQDLGAAPLIKQLAREGTTLYPDGKTIGTISRVVVNADNGYAIHSGTTDNPSIDRFFGSITRGGPASVLLSETDLGSTSFSNLAGYTSSGTVATSAFFPARAFAGTTQVTTPGTAIPSSTRFYGSVTASLASASDPYWVVGTRSTSTGTDNAAMIIKGLSATRVLASGDAVTGEGFIRSGTSIFSTNTAVSNDGDFLITAAAITASAAATTGGTSTVLINGQTVSSPGGVVLKSGASTATWGLSGRTFFNFGALSVNNDGEYAVTGQLNNLGVSSSYVAVNGAVTLFGEQLLAPGVYFNGASFVTINDNGDYVVSGSVRDSIDPNDDTPIIDSALFFNGELLIKVGDAVDTDGDGFGDTTLSSINGPLGAVGFTDTDPLSGKAQIYFIGRVPGDTSTTERLFVISVPEPSAAILPMAGAAALLRRRRA